MIKLLLEPVNLLILDEPTNHLDLQSKEVLKNAIKAFDGTVVVVSHDREFLDGLVDKVYEFSNHKVREHIGGIYDFLQKKQISSLSELERNNGLRNQTGVEKKEPQNSFSKISYEERKERSRQIKKVERSVADVENQIEQIESQIADIEQLFQSVEQSTDENLFRQYEQLKQSLEQKMSEWEVLSAQLDDIKNGTE
jgi:ATP-binding cassette subfamily F protein 3